MCKKYLEDIGLKVNYFSDSENKKWNNNFLGLKCIDKNEIKDIPNVYVFVAVQIHFREVSKYLCAQNIAHINFDRFAINNNILKLENVYNMLDDNFSKEVFVNVLLSRFNSDISLLKQSYTGNQYFQLDRFNKISPNEIFIDCGAFTGDTLIEFIDRFNNFYKYYAFEPFDKNYAQLIKNTNNLLEKKLTAL